MSVALRCECGGQFVCLATANVAGQRTDRLRCEDCGIRCTMAYIVSEEEPDEFLWRKRIA